MLVKKNTIILDGNFAIIQLQGERETTPLLEKATDTATSSIYAKTTLGTFCIPEGCRDAIVKIICS